MPTLSAGKGATSLFPVHPGMRTFPLPDDWERMGLGMMTRDNSNNAYIEGEEVGYIQDGRVQNIRDGQPVM